LLNSKYAMTTNNWNGDWGGYVNPAADALINAIPGETDPAKIKADYTDLTKIYLNDIPSFTLMYRPQDFHTVNASVWTGFPHQGDGTTPPVPPLDETDGWGIAGLYNLFSAPTDVQASDGTYTTKVLISWTASSGVTSYKVYRATSATGTKTLLGNPTVPTFNDTTATPGVTYYYWVNGCQGTNCTAFTGYNTGWRSIVPVPTNVQASDGTSTTQVVVSWTASSGATSYKVYRATSATGTKTLLGSPTITSFNDTTATPGVTYTYWVVAYKGTSFSGFSVYNTGWRKLSPPTHVQASNGTYTTKVLVSWTASSGATSYNVYRANSATGAKTLRGSPTVPTFNDTTATHGVTYYYWVVACKGANCSGYSAYDTGWR
jgi:fibronectin type 3 domain-containing protein